MQPDDYFIVSHHLKAAEDVRNYVKVRGGQLCKGFSVQAADPENPGFCRVTCAPFGRKTDHAPVLKYESALAKFLDWFAIDVDEAKVWRLDEGEKRIQVEALMIDPDAPERIVFSYGKMTVGMEREGTLLSFYKLRSGWTLRVWLKMYDKWKREIEEALKPKARSVDDRLLEKIAMDVSVPLEELRLPLAKGLLEELKANSTKYRLAVEGLEKEDLAAIMG